MDVFLVPRSPAVLENIAKAIAGFITNNLGLLETAFITLLDVVVTLIPVAMDIIVGIATSPILKDVFETLIEMLIGLFPILSGILATLFNTAVVLMQELVTAIINMFIALFEPLMAMITTALPFNLLINLIIAIFLALIDLIPVLIDLLLDLLSDPAGLNIVINLVYALISIVVFFFENEQMRELIPTLIEAILNGILQIFVGDTGFRLDVSALQFIFNIFFGLITKFFGLIAAFITGNAQGQQGQFYLVYETDGINTFLWKYNQGGSCDGSTGSREANLAPCFSYSEDWAKYDNTDPNCDLGRLSGMDATNAMAGIVSNGCYSIEPIDNRGILSLIDPIISFVTTLFGAISNITDILNKLGFMELAMAALEAITYALEPVADLVFTIADAIGSIF